MTKWLTQTNSIFRKKETLEVPLLSNRTPTLLCLPLRILGISRQASNFMGHLRVKIFVKKDPPIPRLSPTKLIPLTTLPTPMASSSPTFSLLHSRLVTAFSNFTLCSLFQRPPINLTPNQASSRQLLQLSRLLHSSPTPAISSHNLSYLLPTKEGQKQQSLLGFKTAKKRFYFLALTLSSLILALLKIARQGGRSWECLLIRKNQGQESCT